MRHKQPVEITLAYLDKFKTPKGGYNKKQVEALGLSWPLVSGWKTALVGNYITGEMADIFESQSVKPVKKKKAKGADLNTAIQTLENKITSLTIKDVYRLRKIEKRWFEIINK